MFIFQPAEEGAPTGEQGGAELMLAEGLFRTIKPDAVYGLHTDNAPGGKVWATTGPVMASADEMRIVVRGRQTHAARPHLGVDPITVAAQIVTALQLIPARQINAVDSPVVISVGRVRGGVRFNIIPDDVELWGTVRVLDPAVYEDVKSRIRRTAEQIAASAGATAEVRFEGSAYPALVNNAAVAERGMAALRRALGAENVLQATPAMTAEDFSFFAREVPGFYFSYGVNAPGVEDAPSNHSPRFFVHEPTMVVGLRALLAVALDRLSGETAAASAVSD
jgi:amidohydrolase